MAGGGGGGRTWIYVLVAGFVLCGAGYALECRRRRRSEARLASARGRHDYSEMVAAIILSVFAGTGAYVMMATAHVKKKYDIALANVSGAITQVPFVVLPGVMLLIAVFAQTGVIPTADTGHVLAIDLETTSVFLLAFPPMLILWKSVQDDGKVDWLETPA